MTYLSDATPVTYMSDGVALPGEDVHQAMGQNAAFSVAGHLLNRPTQEPAGTFSQPGEPTADAHPMAAEQPEHGFQDEPLNQAERAAQHTARNAAAAQDDDQAPAYSFDHAQIARDVRQALRRGMGA